MFEEYIQTQLERVSNCSHIHTISKEVQEKFEANLKELVTLITGSTANKFITDEISGENPYATMLPELITSEQRKKAEETIQQKIQAGTLSLPEPLLEILTIRLKNVTDAFLEMLCRMDKHKEEISSTLLGGKTYTKITDIELSAGDTHNHGRSVVILHTDTGKLVYKPHNMKGDAYIYSLAERFFSEFVGIPKVIAFDDRFGVCEFIEKQRSEGEEEARSFWYNMGGITAFLKILGSTDMHLENITCHGGKPYILDLETILSPIKSNHNTKKRFPQLTEILPHSPYSTGILPSKLKKVEISPFMSTDEKGLAPIVNGEKEPVFHYLDSFHEGYHAAYQQALNRREELAAMLRNAPADMPIRIIIYGTQEYFDIIMRLYNHDSLATAENYQKSKDILSKLLLKHLLPDLKECVASELEQIERGDIPYFYTTAKSRSIFSDGMEIIKDAFEKSATEHALENLYAMGNTDELFDKKLLDRAIRQYPSKILKRERLPKKTLNRTTEPLSKEVALNEAEKLLKEMYSLNIPSPNGSLLWGNCNDDAIGFSFCDVDLFNGLAGLAAFSSALFHATGDAEAKKISEVITENFTDFLQNFYEYHKSYDFAFDYAPQLGEADGIAGIITALSLLKRYSPHSQLDALCTSVIDLLHKSDLQRYGASDRIIGIAGLLSAMCRFEEFRDEKKIIRTLADRLLSLKNLECNGKFLWKPILDKERPISGAGHGLIGIAESLFAATKILDDEKYAEASKDALDFECEIYEKYQPKFGSWADLRSYPPEGIMHGYCSGAPGIGIMIERIKGMNFTNEAIEKLATYAKSAVDTLPLNVRDHLCCGNSSIVEYYLTVGKHEEAGKVLGAMYERKKAEGDYRYQFYDINNGKTPSLFYGMSGIGYEMLRYAFPEKIMSIL